MRLRALCAALPRTCTRMSVRSNPRSATMRSRQRRTINFIFLNRLKGFSLQSGGCLRIAHARAPVGVPPHAQAPARWRALCCGCGVRLAVARLARWHALARGGTRGGTGSGGGHGRAVVAAALGGGGVAGRKARGHARRARVAYAPGGVYRAHQWRRVRGCGVWVAHGGGRWRRQARRGAPACASGASWQHPPWARPGRPWRPWPCAARWPARPCAPWGW